MLNNKIKVYARIKPSSDSRRYHCEIKVNRGDKKKILLLYKETERSSSNLQAKLNEHEEFLFENIFTENASQEIIYNHMARPVVERAVEGFNGTIMAYGQTGTGKTHTICGGADLSMRGIIPRAFKHVFHRMKEMKQTNFKVYLSAMEIYNDHAFDLLTERITKFGLPRLNSKQILPRNLKMAQVSNMHELGKLLKKATNNRVVRNTVMNEVSSRSHCIFSLHLYQNKNSCMAKSKIHMIDLSGSEKIGKKRPSGIMFNESRHINLSLHYIELVIRALSDKNQDHIPYRNSMITSFLRDSLGGTCNTVMIFTLSLDPSFFEETVLTCRFAQRVSLISNKLQKSFSGDSKKIWQEGDMIKSNHKGINCKLDWSDSSFSVSGDCSNETVTTEEIASLKAELETSKRKISELSDQLLHLKTNETFVQPLTSVRNGYSYTPPQNMLPFTTNCLLPNSTGKPSEEDHDPLLQKLGKFMMLSCEQDFSMESKLCALCGKRIRQAMADLTDVTNGIRSGLKDFSQEVQAFTEVHLAQKVKTARSRDKIPCEIVTNPCVLEIESGCKPVLYFIYELMGLALPSKNVITGKPYDSNDIEKYCEFLSLCLNVGSFKKEYYDKHFDLVEKEFQGCYKLNKKMSCLEKLKMKLNEMECYPENNLGEREQLRKLMQEEENKLNHSKVMLEVIRNERLELLKCVKQLRNKLVNMFQQLLQENRNEQKQKGTQKCMVIPFWNNKLYHNKNICPKNTFRDVKDQVKDIFLLETNMEYLGKSAEFQVKSMPDISQDIPDKLNAKSRYHSMNFRIISRSDTTIKVPGKMKYFSSRESKMSSYSKVKKKAHLISSEDSYISFLSEINSAGQSSGIFSLSRESVEPSG